MCLRQGLESRAVGVLLENSPSLVLYAYYRSRVKSSHLAPSAKGDAGVQKSASFDLSQPTSCLSKAQDPAARQPYWRIWLAPPQYDTSDKPRLDAIKELRGRRF